MALTKSKSFFQSNYALSVWVVRILLLLHGIIPIEWIKWIQSPASQSILVDPIYSLEHIREAVAVRNLFDSTAWTESYRAGSIHTPPLVLAFLEPLVTVVPSTHWQALVTGGLLIVIDYHVALNLERIGTLILYHRQYDWEESLYERMPSRIQPAMLHIFPITARRDTTTKHIMFPMEFLPILMAGIYFASPITILCSTVLVSLQNIPLLFLTSAILQAWSGSMVWSAFLLAVATYWNLHYLIFSIPLVILLRERRHSNASTVWLLAYLLGSIALQVLALLLVGQNNYVRVVTSTHGYTFAIQGLSPSLSTLWYLGMQLFQRFATYTTTLLGIAPYLLVIPLYIRLSRYPETLFPIFWLLGTLFRPPATLYSLNVAFSLLCLAPRSLARLKVLPVLMAVAGAWIPVSLYLVTYWLWLETNSGEANFTFFQCLAYNVLVAIILIQFTAATLRRDKALRVTDNIMEVCTRTSGVGTER